MTRVFTDGAEMGDLLFWNGANSASLAINSSTKRTGVYSYNNGAGGYQIRLLSPALAEFYFRMAFYTSACDRRMFAWYGGASVEQGYLTINSADKIIRYYVGTTNVATGAYPILLNAWNVFEIHVKIDASSGVINVKLNGSTDVNYSGDTYHNAATINQLRVLGQWTSTQYWDDLALNDISNTDGKNDNSWCGDGRVVKVTPNGNGTHNNWTGSDGNQTDNYLLVDEYPADNETTYVYADSSSSGTQDQYSMSDDFSGTDKTILRIYPEARARKTSADSSQIKLGILPSGGSDQLSAAQDLVTTYNRVVGDSYKVNPVDSQAWEEADIDAIEGIVEVP